MLQPTHHAWPLRAEARDRLGRRLEDLRLSVIDRCNFRCGYCMPASSLMEKSPFLPRGQLLTMNEIERLVRAFADLGVRKVRLTGGEPLLRPDLVDIIAALKGVRGLEDLSMTTNGVLLPKLAPALRRAGLKRITVSLDSLDPAVFKRMSGGRSSPLAVLDGISAATAAGFSQIKINCVVKKGVNDHTVMDLVEHFRGSGHIVRLIEFLDVGNSNEWQRDHVVPGSEWRRRIHARWPLIPLSRLQDSETAERYAFRDGLGEIGLINSITMPFCRHCSRMRVTANGHLYSCLFAAAGTPLLPLLRGSDDDAALPGYLRNVWFRRSDRYSETRDLQAPNTGKQEMFRIGG